MTERDKWGRIPVKLVEVDQEFCALRNGEGKCQAGPINNYQIYSRKPGNSDGFWDTNGNPTATTPGFIRPPAYRVYNIVEMISLFESEYITVPLSSRAFLPVFTQTDVYTFSAYINRYEDIAVFNIGVTTNGGTTVTYRGLTVDFSDLSASGLDAGVSNYQAEVDGDWTRISFDLDVSVVVSDGTAYSVFFDVPALPATLSLSMYLTQPQISSGGLQDFRVTDDRAKFSDLQPCFNTLSSCQNVENYTVQGQNDALRLTFRS